MYAFLHASFQATNFALVYSCFLRPHVQVVVNLNKPRPKQNAPFRRLQCTTTNEPRTTTTDPCPTCYCSDSLNLFYMNNYR
jgi:hypothetical protein